MNCRPSCGACCTAPSISSAIPGMPRGKAAGERCVQLDNAERCLLFGMLQRPAVCSSLRPTPEMCGIDRTHAIAWLGKLEIHTSPGNQAGPRAPHARQ